MPICTTSANSALLLGVLTLALPVAAAGAQPAAPVTPPGRQVGGAPAASGDEAVARLRATIAVRKAAAPADPPTAMPPAAIDAQRRRAFEALGHRKQDRAIEARARSAAVAGRQAVALERDAMARRLGEALGLSPPDTAMLAKAAPPAGPAAFVPLLFVSSSMPVATLRAYAAQIERSGGAMAFRGMPGGLKRVAPMARLSADILAVDPGCEGPACAMRDVQIVVDPIAFRQHAVTRVPALAMVPGDPAQPYCERDDSAPAPAGPIVYGDAALSGLFEQYARLGGAKEVRDAQARLERR